MVAHLQVSRFMSGKVNTGKHYSTKLQHDH